jgi:choloylglycine hydrolase
MLNLASFELIPYILGNCATLDEAVNALSKANIVPDSFSASLTSTPMHWLFSDSSGCVVAEPLENGLSVKKNDFGVLTNEPSFDFHAKNLTSYMHLSATAQVNAICPSVPLTHFSRGTGAFGMPGDHSSASRFIRAVFTKNHTAGEQEVSKFFHIMDTLGVPLGCALTENGEPIRTVYTSCADADDHTYYFTTYECRRIRAVRLSESAMKSDLLTVFPIDKDEDISYLN